MFYDRNGKKPYAYTDKKEVYFMGRLVIDGENVYELDEKCLQEKHKEELRQKRLQHTKTTDQPDSNQQKRKF